jgi:hypothetical protein
MTLRTENPAAIRPRQVLTQSQINALKHIDTFQTVRVRGGWLGPHRKINLSTTRVLMGHRLIAERANNYLGRRELNLTPDGRQALSRLSQKTGGPAARH